MALFQIWRSEASAAPSDRRKTLRTRTSLCAACHALGVHASVLNPGSDMWRMEFNDGVVMNGDAAEHVRDAVGVLAQMHDVVAVRAFASLTDRNADLGDEMADVLWVLMALANQTGIDLTEAFRTNMKKKSTRDAQRHINNPKLK